MGFHSSEHGEGALMGSVRGVVFVRYACELTGGLRRWLNCGKRAPMSRVERVGGWGWIAMASNATKRVHVVFL